jgi:hypothetical protein
MSREYLAAWKNDYPFSPDPDAVVFLTNRKEPITYESIRKQIGYIAQRAGIHRKITPHLFRHSRITHLIQQGVPDSVIKLMMWGTVKTDMFETYAHLTGCDIDRAIFELSGIKQTNENLKKMEPRQCHHCNTVCAPLSNFCSTCGSPLTEDSLKERNSLQKALDLEFANFSNRDLERLALLVAENLTKKAGLSKG